MPQTTLTGNGSLTVDNFPAFSAAVVLSGTFGGGTATITIAEGTNATPITFDSATSAYSEEVVVGVGNTIDVTLSGATGPSLTIAIVPLRA